MAYVPMNRARALIICTRPQDYAPSRVHAAVCYLDILANATAEELELAKVLVSDPRWRESQTAGRRRIGH